MTGGRAGRGARVTGASVSGGAAAFVRGVHGSVTNVVGLPLAELRELLRDAEARHRPAGS